MEVKELMDAFAQEIGLADDARRLGGACDSKGTIPPSLRKAVIDKLNELAETRKNRVDGDYQNPFHALTKGKTLRQSRFSRIDSQNGKVLNAGTNQCFVNHLINAMLKSNDPRVNVKLWDMFRADGCTLKTDKGDVFECSYGDQSQDGEQSIFEKTLAAHLKRRCGLDRDGEFPAGTSELGAQILGAGNDESQLRLFRHQGC